MSVDRQFAGLYIVYPGLLGAVIGSFLNVCILRWGADPKQSVVRPPSSCPRCARRLVWYDNIPVLSYVFLTGRCRNCKKKISARYPLIEALSGTISALLYLKLGLTIDWAIFFAFSARKRGSSSKQSV